MLKREITYEDFNGDTVTEVFYFNLSKPEIIELEVENQGGLRQWLQNIIETGDRKNLVEQFKKLILRAYGQKSEDGKRFIKNEQLREEFSQTAAYPVLFMELAEKEEAAAQFIKGILPKDMVAEIEKAEAPKTEPPAVTSPTS